MAVTGLQLNDPWTVRRVIEAYPRDLAWLRRCQRAAFAMREQGILTNEEADDLHLEAQRLINRRLHRMRAGATVRVQKGRVTKYAAVPA
jgi:hypothetical protein